jgi:hypothetical protein
LLNVSGTGRTLVPFSADDAVTDTIAEPFRFDDLAAKLGDAITKGLPSLTRSAAGTGRAYLSSTGYGGGIGVHFVAARADNPMPPAGAEPSRFDHLASEFGDTITKRPLGHGWVFTRTGHAESVPLEYVARPWAPLMALRADNAVWILAAEPFRFHDATAEFGDAPAERPLSSPGVVSSACTAYTVPLLHRVRHGVRLVACSAYDAVTRLTSEPLRFDDSAAEFGYLLLECLPCGFRVFTCAGSAEPSAELQTARGRRGLVTESARDTVRSADSEPLRFNYATAEFSYPIAELLPHDS